MGDTRQVLVKLSEREYQWMMDYAARHDFTLNAALRAAIRTHNMLHLTPGAMDAVVSLQPRWPMMDVGVDDVP